MLKMVLQLEHFADNINRIYFKYPEERFVGRFEFTKPVLVIRDIELIKKITIKDFEHFLDHRIFIPKETDPFFARNLFSIKGQEWKDMRSTLSPAFTSSKIRVMVPFMLEVGDQMIFNLKNEIKKSGLSYLDVEMRDITTRYSNDVIASCAFGLKVDSHTNRDNEFYAQGLIAATFKFKQLLAFFLSSSIPWLLRVSINDVIASRAFGLKVDSHTNRDNEFYAQGLVAATFKFKQLLAFFISSSIPWLLRVSINDVIASCAFGLKVDSHTNRDNEFYAQGLVAATFKFKQLLAFFLSSSIPWLLRVLNLKIFGTETTNYFRNLLRTTMSEREKNNIVRPDMIHLLMEAKKGKLKYDENLQVDDNAGYATVEESAVGKKTVLIEWKEDDLIAQAVVFFIGGFETVSSTITILLYELAVNPDVQDKLVTEIRETHARNGGKLDFNVIQQMPYMDMVVSELLRKWSPAIALDRLCTKDYNLGKPNDDATEDYVIRKGEGLLIPVWPLHHDPEFFPDPDKFDPERFSEENKRNIKPFTYMPFGLGPRNCIGSRFALCEVKVMAYQLLQHIEVVPGPRTPIPAQLDPSTFNLRIKGGHWLRIKLRS